VAQPFSLATALLLLSRRRIDLLDAQSLLAATASVLAAAATKNPEKCAEKSCELA